MLFQTPSFGLFLVVVVLVATALDRRATARQVPSPSPQSVR